MATILTAIIVFDFLLVILLIPLIVASRSRQSEIGPPEWMADIDDRPPSEAARRFARDP